MEATGISPLRRVLSAVMAVVLVMGLMPSAAWAAGANAEGGDSQASEVTSPAAADSADQAKADAVAAKFTGYAFPIRYAKGYANAAEAVLDTIKGYDEYAEGMTVTLKSRDEGSNAIAADGTIAYRTGDLGYTNVSNVSNCVFTIAYNGATADTAPRTVQVGWDLDYYKKKMQKEADARTADSIKGDNASLDEVTTDLVLKGSGANSIGSSWSKVTWTSSNPDVIAVKSVDYSNDYKGVVTQPAGEDAKVTLTATYVANDTKLTSNCESVDEIGSITKTFEVTVKGAEQKVLSEEEMGQLLDKYYLPAITSGDIALSEGSQITEDVALPRYTRIKFVDDDAKLYPNHNSEVCVFNNKEITVTSNNSAIKINGYRGAVDRFTGEESTVLTVTFTRDGVTAKRTLTLKVVPDVTDEMLDAEYAKLQKVIAAYWEGVNDGVYADVDSVTGSLHNFQEANVDDEGNVTFVYSADGKSNAGFKPDNFFEDSWEMEGAGYNLFKSSNPSVLQHENLVMPEGGQPADSVKVTISSLISSEKYGSMAAAHPDDEKLARLYKQPVEVTVTVLGTKIVAARAAVEGLKAVDELTEADKEAVVAARAAYDGLSALDKQLFGEELVQKLTAAEDKLGIVVDPTPDPGPEIVTPAPEPAKPVSVFVTVSNKGAAVLAHQKVTASDLDKDGSITLDEALQATHKKYCKGGYATVKSAYGAMVTRIWGIDTSNVIFYRNDSSTNTVDVEKVAAGDEIVAAVMKDDVTWSDHYAFFNKKQVTVNAGKSFTLTLSADYWGARMKVPGARVGTWSNGKFTALKGKTTSADGKVTLSFSKPGTYVVGANGTVNDGAMTKCPLTASVCVVTVTKAANTMKVSSKAKTVKRSVVKTKAATVAPIVVSKAKGATSFKVTKWNVAKAKKYFKVNAKTGKITVKKGTPVGVYKFNVKVTAKGDQKFKAASVTKTVTIKVVNK